LLSIQPTEHCLYASISEQKIYLFADGICTHTYPCRFSARPPSCIENSLGTPVGLHKIAQKIGDGAPPGMVFKGRVATGRLYSEDMAGERGNTVTSRILWLQGLEPGKNRGPGCDSFNRYIYIHGTNQEANFGAARSHGCVLLRNADVIDLYDRLACQSVVLIE